MKKKEALSRLARELIARKDGYRVVRNLIVMPPVRPLVRGVILEGASFDKVLFTVTAFVFPLCIPAERLYFNFGIRIRDQRGGDVWSLDNAALKAELCEALNHQALPFLLKARSLLAFVDIARGFSQSNPHTVRAIAYSLARSGHIAEALKELDRLSRELEISVPWQRDLALEAEHLSAQLKEQPAEALRQLQFWEEETERNLRL